VIANFKGLARVQSPLSIEVTQKFLFLGINTDDGITRCFIVLPECFDTLKLGVTIDMSTGGFFL
jgi:hypothetical protein